MRIAIFVVLLTSYTAPGLPTTQTRGPPSRILWLQLNDGSTSWNSNGRVDVAIACCIMRAARCAWQRYPIGRPERANYIIHVAPKIGFCGLETTSKTSNRIVDQLSIIYTTQIQMQISLISIVCHEEDMPLP